MIPEGDDDTSVDNCVTLDLKFPGRLKTLRFNLESYYHKSVLSRLMGGGKSFLDKVSLNRLRTR
jgi:hypothetical protein